MGNLCNAPGGDEANHTIQGKYENINLAEFLSVCIFLSEECGKVIREVEESGILKTMSKTDNSPVTIADIKVQKTIEECLGALYPTLNIQGEESKESMEQVDAAITHEVITKARKTFIPSSFLNDSHNRRSGYIQSLRKTYDEEDI